MADDDIRASKIEVEFYVPVVVTQGQWRKIADVIDEILKNPGSCPEGHVHWLSGYGAKPLFSKADARFLGVPVPPDAPESGEPEWDDSVIHFSTYCRPAYPGEKK